jgi:hypothetical protein
MSHEFEAGGNRNYELECLTSININLPEAHGSIDGSGAMIQAGRSWVRDPMRSLNFFDLPNHSSRTMALRFTQPLKEMSIRNLPGAKGRQACKSHNLTATCEPIV